MKKLINSKTFWGGIVFAATKILEAAGMIPPTVANAVESVAVGLGLYGARNTKYGSKNPS